VKDEEDEEEERGDRRSARPDGVQSKHPPSLMWDRSDAKLITDDVERWDAWEARFRECRHRPDLGQGVLAEVEAHRLHDRAEFIAYHIAKECSELPMSSSDEAQRKEMAHREDEERLRSNLRDVIAFLRRGSKTVFDLHWHLKSEVGLSVSPNAIFRFMTKLYATKDEKEDKDDADASQVSNLSFSSGEQRSRQPSTIPVGSVGPVRRRDARAELFERLFSARPTDEVLEGYDEFEQLLAGADRRDRVRAQREEDATARRKRATAKRQRSLRQQRQRRQTQSFWGAGAGDSEGDGDSAGEHSFSLFPSTPAREPGAHRPQLSPFGRSPLPSPIVPFGTARWAYNGRGGAAATKVEPEDDDGDNGEDENEDEEDEEDEEEENYYQMGIEELARKWKKREIEMRQRLNLEPMELAGASQASAAAPATAVSSQRSASPWSHTQEEDELFSSPDFLRTDDSQELQPRTPTPHQQRAHSQSDSTSPSRPFKRPLFPSSKRSASQSLIASQHSQGGSAPTVSTPSTPKRLERGSSFPSPLSPPSTPPVRTRTSLASPLSRLSPIAHATTPPPPMAPSTPSPPSPSPSPSPSSSPVTPNISSAARRTRAAAAGTKRKRAEGF
jgi:hypothetical protein